MLEKKIKEFGKDNKGTRIIEVPLEKDVIDAILEMVRGFDASEFGAIGPETEVRYLRVCTDDQVACACVNIIGERSTIFPRGYAGGWDPPEADVRTERFCESFSFYADGITEDMTVGDVIKAMDEQSHEDEELVDELYELTKDTVEERR